MSNIPEIKAHLFICTNHRDVGDSCAAKGSKELREKLKNQFRQKDVRINTAGCLGRCEHGILAVLYPEGKWFSGLTTESGPLLEEAVKRSLE